MGRKSASHAGMHGACLEPDPRYQSCCSSVFRPGRVLRDCCLGLVVLVVIAVVIAAMFLLVFFVLKDLTAPKQSNATALSNGSTHGENGGPKLQESRDRGGRREDEYNINDISVAGEDLSQWDDIKELESEMEESKNKSELSTTLVLKPDILVTSEPEPEPEPETSVAPGPESSTTTTVFENTPEFSITLEPESEPSATPEPEPKSTTTLPTTVEPEPSNTLEPEPSTTPEPEPTADSESELLITPESELSTTPEPEPPTTLVYELPTIPESELPTTPKSNIPITSELETSTPQPEPSTTHISEPSTTPNSELSTTSQLELSITSQPKFSTTSQPEFLTTPEPERSTTPEPEPSTTSESLVPSQEEIDAAIRQFELLLSGSVDREVPTTSRSEPTTAWTTEREPAGVEDLELLGLFTTPQPTSSEAPSAPITFEATGTVRQPPQSRPSEPRTIAEAVLAFERSTEPPTLKETAAHEVDTEPTVNDASAAGAGAVEQPPADVPTTGSPPAGPEPALVSSAGSLSEQRGDSVDRPFLQTAVPPPSVADVSADVTAVAAGGLSEVAPPDDLATRPPDSAGQTFDVVVSGSAAGGASVGGDEIVTSAALPEWATTVTPDRSRPEGRTVTERSHVAGDRGAPPTGTTLSSLLSGGSLAALARDGLSDLMEKRPEGRSLNSDPIDQLLGDAIPQTGCRLDQYRCAGSSGPCVDASRLCDGVNDCRDGDDELVCPTAVSSDHTQSAASAGEQAGGGQEPAPEPAPEPAGALCSVGKLRCLTGTCILLEQVCDGVAQCPDGADELNCRE